MAHAVTVTVLTSAPAAPVIVANTMLGSTVSDGIRTRRACPTIGDAKYAKNPTAKPIAANIATTPALDATHVTYC